MPSMIYPRLQERVEEMQIINDFTVYLSNKSDSSIKTILSKLVEAYHIQRNQMSFLLLLNALRLRVGSDDVECSRCQRAGVDSTNIHRREEWKQDTGNSGVDEDDTIFGVTQLSYGKFVPGGGDTLRLL